MVTERPESVIGAVIFFSYIIAALFFTMFISRDLIQLYLQSYDTKVLKTQPLTEIAKRRERGQLFIALSLLSFATLSYQMLTFLIQSYSMWSELSGFPYPVKLLGEKGIFDLRGHQTKLYVWNWSKRSTLFRDFAEALVNVPRHFWWTQQALLYSLAWNMYMAVAGTVYDIPHLWAYYALDQILPISFTQNLFCAALFFSHSVSQAPNLKAAAPVDQFVLVLIYLLGLSVAPAIVGENSIFVLIVAVRVLLFAPYWMMRPAIRSSTSRVNGTGRDLYWQYRYAALILTVGGSFLHFQQTQSTMPIMETVKTIGDNPAVAALGYDYVLGIISLAVYFLSSKI